MPRSEELPEWLAGKRFGRAVVMNRHNGAMTQGLIEKGKGAIGYWQVSGYVPGERQVVVLAKLTDSEAQAVYDADPLAEGFLEPVWRSIKDNWITVHVRHLDNRHSEIKGQIPRTVSADEFLHWVERLADEASISTGSVGGGPKPGRRYGAEYGSKPYRLMLRSNQGIIKARFAVPPLRVTSEVSEMVLWEGRVQSPLNDKKRNKGKKNGLSGAKKLRRKTSL